MNCIKNYYFIILLFCMACGSCHNESITYIMRETQKVGSVHYSHSVDSVKLEIDSAEINSYIVFCPYSDAHTDYFVGYNPKNSSLNIYDLNAKIGVKKIFFNIDGPKAIGRAESIYVHNLDSIFISTEENIFLIDTAYKIKRKIRINGFQQEIKGINFAKYIFSNKDPSLRLYYQPNRKSLFLYAYSITTDYSKTAYYRDKFIYELSLDNLTARPLPIPYSALYLEKGKFYSSLNKPNLTFKGDSIIYNFPIDPNIYIYNTQTDKISVYGGQSENSKNKAYSMEPSDVGNSEKEMRWIIENTIFHQVVFDPYKRLYYRIHDGGIPYQMNTSSFNAFGDKPYFLSVYDEKFRLIDEIRLSKNKYNPNSYFLTRKGLWLANTGYRNTNQKESELSFDLFDFTPDKSL